MDWKTMLGYVSGSVDEKLLLRNGYLVAENRVLRNQIQGRLRLTDAKRPGATVLSPFVFLDTTRRIQGLAGTSFWTVWTSPAYGGSGSKPLGLTLRCLLRFL